MLFRTLASCLPPLYYGGLLIWAVMNMTTSLRFDEGGESMYMAVLLLYLKVSKFDDADRSRR